MFANCSLCFSCILYGIREIKSRTSKSVSSDVERCLFYWERICAMLCPLGRVWCASRSKRRAGKRLSSLPAFPCLGLSSAIRENMSCRDSTVSSSKSPAEPDRPRPNAIIFFCSRQKEGHALNFSPARVQRY